MKYLYIYQVWSTCAPTSFLYCHMYANAQKVYALVQCALQCNVACNFEFAVGKHHHACSNSSIILINSDTKKIKGKIWPSRKRSLVCFSMRNFILSFVFLLASLAEKGRIPYTNIGIISFHVSYACLMNTSHCIADRTAGAEETAATETAGKEWPQRQMRKPRPCLDLNP